jgi:hypothetical protein
MDDPQSGTTAIGQGAGDEGPQAPPATLSATPAAPPAAPAAAGGSGAPSAGSGSPNPAASGTPAPPAAPPAAQAVPKPPTAKRGGLGGVIDSLLDDLAGTKGGAKLHQGTDGNYYVDTPELSRKGQWLKIASEALHGAAAGAAHMQGPGAAGRGLAAGVEAGDKLATQQQDQNKEVNAEARQKNQDLVNAVKLKHDMAAKEFELQRMKVNANDEDIKFSQEQMDREKKLGSADLGIYKDEADLTRVKEQNPNFWKDVYANNVVAVPELNEKGERQGIHVFLRTPGIGSQMVDPGTPIRIYDRGKKTMTTQVPTVPLTHDQLDAYNASADNQQRQDQIDGNTDAFNAEKLKHEKASTAHEQAETGKLNREKDEEKPIDPAIVDGIGTGRIAPTTLNRMLTSKDGQKLINDVAAKYPDFDTSKLGQYPKLYVDFTSGKSAQQRQNLDTAFKTLNDLTTLNTYASRLPIGPARTAWDNKLDTASQEIANGLTKPGSTATQDQIHGVKTSLNTRFSRQAALDKQADSLIEQYESMRDRWKSGAPSAAYEAHMPDVGPQTKALIYKHDPQKYGQVFGVPLYDKPEKQGGRLIGFTRDGGKTMEAVQP